MALLSGTVCASLIWIYSDDPVWNGLSAYLGFVVAFVVHVSMAIITKGRTYFIDPSDARIGINGAKR